jgi:hypothetical protein
MANETKSNSEIIGGILQKYLSGLTTEKITPDSIKQLIVYVSTEVSAALSNSMLKERLEILFDYEKKYLELTKTYKEEIKFAASLQEDIRKERSNFFAETLKEVHKTLEDVKMDKKAIDLWITELVNSYTKSLDVSSDLSKDHTIEMMGILRDASKKGADEIHSGKIDKSSDK